VSEVRRLGLLGGMSWESSIEYERIINELVRERLGGVASADLLIRSFNFADIEALQDSGRWDEAGDLLAAAAAHLEAGGAEAVVICTNTMHRSPTSCRRPCRCRCCTSPTRPRPP
jgi:aspartate racemase